MNSIDVDDDGHILLSSRSSSECTKINRDTGEVIWRLGGTHSTLTFVNDPLNGPRNQHGFRALGHGHYILFDNGNLHSPPVSRAVEYVVDPVAQTATLVWQFRDTPDKYAYYMGNVQRLTNGNTHINWVLAGYPKACEVDPNGVKQLELNLAPGYDLYRVVAAPLGWGRARALFDRRTLPGQCHPDLQQVRRHQRKLLSYLWRHFAAAHHLARHHLLDPRASQ